MADALTDFVNDPRNLKEKIELSDLESLLGALAKAERPRSFRVLIWLLLKTLQRDPELHASLTEKWLPSEKDLAQLLEDAGVCGAQAVLSLEAVKGRLERLWTLCDSVEVPNLVSTSNAWEAVSLAPMAALHTEQQLDDLIAAVARDRPWKDPAEILSPECDGEFDLEALLALAQSRMVNLEGGEALGVVVLRLLDCAEKIH